jgi:hypothetical protein
MAFTGTDHGLLRSNWGPWARVPECEALGAPISVEEFLWHLGPATSELSASKIFRHFRHDPGLQIPRLRYSPGLAPTTRLNALLNAASDS